MAKESKKKATGYDKYIDWKLFAIPVVLFFLILILPTSEGMKDVGAEYKVGPKVVVAYIIQGTCSTPPVPMPSSGSFSRPGSWSRTCRWGRFQKPAS